MAQDFEISIENGAYVVKFPYSPRLVDALKGTIPNTGRAWDGQRKAWIIAAQYKKEAQKATGFPFPDIATSKPVTETKLLEVRYLGQCKERAPGDVSAMGLLKNGRWDVIFPMQTLTEWFEDGGSVQAAPDKPKTLYAILGAKQADDENAIKKAFLRMAKQWHPDVCKEPNANEMFIRIREAYDILRVPRSKGRYDAGLAFEMMEAKDNKDKRNLADVFADASIYRAPLRCGWIMCEGVESIGRFVVSKISAWEDITNSHGQVLVVSWQMGDKAPVEVWA